MSEIEHYIGVNLTAAADDQVMDDLVHQLRTHPAVDYAVAMADGPEKAPRPEPTREQLPIMGRELALIDKLAKQLRTEAQDRVHAVGDLRLHRRGESFEVMIHVEGEPTGHVARVTVELDRFDRELVESYQREQGQR